jgi:hypothetical protein
MRMPRELRCSVESWTPGSLAGDLECALDVSCCQSAVTEGLRYRLVSTHEFINAEYNVLYQLYMHNVSVYEYFWHRSRCKIGRSRYHDHLDPRAKTPSPSLFSKDIYHCTLTQIY